MCKSPRENFFKRKFGKVYLGKKSLTEKRKNKEKPQKNAFYQVTNKSGFFRVFSRFSLGKQVN